MPKYEICHPLGRGGSGSVYAVRDIITGDMYAVKLIKIPDDIYERKLIEPEKELANLCHDNIVKCYEISEITAENSNFIGVPESFRKAKHIMAIRMELCDQGDLETILTKRDKIDIDWNNNIFGQILSGVKYLHEKNIVHRDLKPSNILLKGSIAKITDFGCSKLCGMANSRSVCGTPIYMAPEAWNGKFNKEIDIYSLGIMLIRFYTKNGIFWNWVQHWKGGRSSYGMNIPELICADENLRDFIKAMICKPEIRPNIIVLSEQFNILKNQPLVVNINVDDSTAIHTTMNQPLVVNINVDDSTAIHLTKTVIEKCTKGKLLCLDGGGIRGLVEAKMLQHIEEKTERKIKHSFEYIAGTSTGGLLALYLGLNKSAKECEKLYLTLKDFVFGTRSYKEIVECLSTGRNLETVVENVKSHTDTYEKVLKQFFGAETRMSDIKNVKVIITVTLADCLPMKLIHYTNFDPKTKNELIWKVARATSAAPTYFKTFYINDLGPLIDGGLTSNNPTLTALTQVVRQNKILGRKQNFVNLVVSMGTGKMPDEKREFPNFPTCDEKLRKIWEYIKLPFNNGLNAYHLFMDEITRTDGHIIDQAKTFCEVGGAKYFRFNPDLSLKIELNEVDSLKIKKMLKETDVFIKSHFIEFQSCISYVLKTYK